ncbi:MULTISPECIES: uroporphyrinogen-III synthase [unclassified Modestobacter]|uniref:uroporphyrinogen-III synthase n=1 Tax=unclassified Modestobacter TaxID=2643866 RepID=UPI0022AA59D3|nr:MULTISPECIES: uroporphyrinogen-III synthase [unclassified Modestobacter]MCZ2825055.1 uroporphyrinogen-III synthase [Modestobacter sp. VKM Ac-2981]MCZ2854442.1 uroporphyrinogen-III synthase [Modestobacter sp. VKM Ac-2982]
MTDSQLDHPVASPAGEPPVPDLLPLAGYTVAVTAARRSEELGALLDRRGARVLYAPAIRIVPLSDDADLVAATREVLAAPVDLVVATTGVGFRGWLEAAEAWDLPLREHLATARVLARGPKARGAIRGAGLVDAWSPESESSAEVLSHLLSGAEGPLPGRRIAVQLHGDPLPELVSGLVRAGAEVVKVPVYRWVLPEDTAPLRRLVTVIAARAVDAVTFTSAPAAASLLQVAEEEGVYPGVLGALTDAVLPVAVGPVTAGPLEAAGIRTAQPERARLGALAREVVSALPARHPVLHSGAHTLQVRGHAAVLDGRLVELAPGPMAVLRALARRPGVVVSRADLLGELSGGGDAHAVEMAVTRLRAALGAPVVQTVVKRGYRLAV